VGVLIAYVTWYVLLRIRCVVCVRRTTTRQSQRELACLAYLLLHSVVVKTSLSFRVHLLPVIRLGIFFCKGILSIFYKIFLRDIHNLRWCTRSVVCFACVRFAV